MRGGRDIAAVALTCSCPIEVAQKRHQMYVMPVSKLSSSPIS
jgi:hypothetical protein